MEWQPVFGFLYLALGIVLVVFARPIAVWDYVYDIKWKILVNLGLPFRIWFLRIGGALLALVGALALAPYLLLL